MTQKFILYNRQCRDKAIEAVRQAGDEYIVTITEPKRSMVQNSLMWCLLNELADQVEWHGQKLSAENWKDMCTAALKKQEVVPGIEGGFVVLGTSTRKMTKLEMSELIEFVYSFGAEHGVQFGE
jgi:16S rRNA U1498 N3-methylase RsmE